MPRTLLPTGDRVLVRLIQPTATTPGGIVLPEPEKGKTVREGEVVAVGPGRVSDAGIAPPPPAGLSARVIFGIHAGINFEEAGEKMVLLRADEVLMVVVE